MSAPRSPCGRAAASAHEHLLIAEPMFLAGCAERAGTGILDMIARCRRAGLPAPRFRQSGGQFIQTLRRRRPVDLARGVSEFTPEVTSEVTPEVRLVRALRGEMPREQLRQALGLSDDKHFRQAFLHPALEAGLVAMTIPEKPRSSKQKYRRTPKGAAVARGRR
jgi:predicted HTH transcriptional regulator